MNTTTTVLIVASWLLVVGLWVVYLEVKTVKTGVEIRRLLKYEEETVERLRAVELRYNRLLNPARLDGLLDEHLRAVEEETGGGVEGDQEESRQATGFTL